MVNNPPLDQRKRNRQREQYALQRADSAHQRASQTQEPGGPCEPPIPLQISFTYWSAEQSFGAERSGRIVAGELQGLEIGLAALRPSVANLDRRQSCLELATAI